MSLANPVVLTSVKWPIAKRDLVSVTAPAPDIPVTAVTRSSAILIYPAVAAGADGVK